MSAQPNDTGVIRAAWGVTLEPGEYEVVETHSNDDAPILRISETFRVRSSQSPVLHNYCHYWQIVTWDEGANAKHGESTWVTAVRRIDPKPASEPVAARAGLDSKECGELLLSITRELRHWGCAGTQSPAWQAASQLAAMLGVEEVAGG